MNIYSTAGWQLTLCDPIRRMSSRIAASRVTLYFTFITRLHVAVLHGVRPCVTVAVGGDVVRDVLLDEAHQLSLTSTAATQH